MPDYDKILYNCNFALNVNNTSIRASKITSIEAAVETETLQEGGLNAYVHVLVKPAQSLKKLVIERGFCSSIDKFNLEKLLGVKQTNPITITIYNKDGSKVIHTYRVEGWTLIRWALSEFDAKKSEMLIETAEISYETLRTQ